MSQTHEEITAIYRKWVKQEAWKWVPSFLDTQANANALHACLVQRGHAYTPDNLTNAAMALNREGKLQLRSTEMAAQEAAAKARAEERQRQAQQNIDVVNLWLKNHAPLGLLASNGEPYAADIDRFVEFVNRNYGGVFTVEGLNAAVAVLSPVLTWFSNDPGDRELRNVPPPPPRRLSVQARKDAGLLPVNPNAPISHTKDKPVLTPEQIAAQTKAAIMKQFGMPSEEQVWQNKAEALSINGKRGTNWAQTDQLRKVFAKNTRTGQVDWKRTYEERYKMAEILERAKNR